MLRLPGNVFDSARKQGEEAFPNECCGILLGKSKGDTREVIEAIPMQNSFDEKEKYHRFLITPEQYRAAEQTARQKKYDILGFYHSHPDAPSVPSKYDLDHAFPWFSYIIVSIMKGKYHDHHSWIMDDDRSKFSEEVVSIV